MSRRTPDDDGIERDVRDELAFHREMRATDPAPLNTPSTATPDALVRLARSRDRWLTWTRIFNELRFDLVDSLRRLRRAPAFTLGAIGILSLGLGATASVFGLANMLYFRALPFADDERLVRVQETSPLPDGTVHWVDSSTPTLMAVKTSDAFAGGAALRSSAAALVTRGGEARHIAVGEVGEGWSSVVGLTAVAGRLFTAEEERQGDGAGVAVISHLLWQTHFGGRPDAIGAPLVFDGGSRTVIGVLPPGFRFPYDEDAWWPASYPPDGRGLFIYGRLKPGVSMAAANAQLATAAVALNREWPLVIRGMVPQARSIRSAIVQDDDRMVLLLAWSVAVLLLIVGSNVAMLLTTRIVSRERELAMRAALGCGWGRQIRHLMLEAMLVFLAGGLAGLGVAWIARQTIGSVLPPRMATQLPMGAVAIDWRVAAFTVLLALVAGALFGAISAWRTTKSGRSVAGAASKAIGSAKGKRTAGALIAVELALASALLAASAIVGGALAQVERRDVGFETDRLLTLQFELTGERLGTAAGHVQTLTRLEERFRALPGVEAVGTTTVNPLCCGDWGSRATPEGPFVRLEDAATVNWRLVSPTFFDAMGIRVLSGRVFDVHDNVNGEPVVIVDSRFARRFWPGEDAIGKRVKRGGTDSSTPWMRVVGVVSAIEDAGEFTESWYVPYLQQPAAGSTGSLHVMVRVADVNGMPAVLRRAVAEVDPALAVIELRTMTDVKRSELSQQRLGAGVAIIFAVVGGLLALSGVYGLVAFVVAGEAREMGIRMALGATAGRVMRDVIGRVGRLSVTGAAIGLVVAAVSQRHVIDALGARPENFLAVSALMALGLVAAAMAAAAIPARRVLRMEIRNTLG